MTKPAAQPRWIGAVLALAVLVADQASKWWLLEDVFQPPMREVISVTSFFNLVMGWNRGISFGMFNADHGWGAWVFGGIAIAIVIALALWLWRTQARLEAVALGLIIGGAIGNVIDRARFGAVFDFLDFHVSGHHWPAFNVADSAISVGAVTLIVSSLFVGRERRKTQAD